MGNRNCERIPVDDIEVKFFYHKKIYKGTISNLSTKGMYIIINERLIPNDLHVDLFILLSDDIFHVPTRIIRILQTNDLNYGMGVEFLTLPKKYLEFLIKLDLTQS